MLLSILNIIRTIMIFRIVQSFDAGWSSIIPFTDTSVSDDITHYGITECALLRVGAKYLKTVYGTALLDSIVSGTDICRTPSDDRKLIDNVAKQLRIDSNFRSVVYTICVNNVVVDLTDLLAAESHFDDETFTNASRLVYFWMNVVTKELTDDNLIFARLAFGRAMHTLQDFYSHSNWIELKNTAPNDNIGSGEALGYYAPLTMRTCENCTGATCALFNIVPDIINNGILTSGYFSLFPWTKKPNGKCSHGGGSDETKSQDAAGFGINKDSTSKDHGMHHPSAAKVALQATINKLDALRSTVGDEQFGRFLGFKTTTLAIVIDTTGSMSPYLELVKEMAIRIVESTTEDSSFIYPHTYILSPFNDPDTGPLTVTNDPNELIDAISALTATGGDDTPELYYHGLVAALSRCELDSSIFTFTDAPAKDGYLRNQVFARIIELNARVYSFYAGYIFSGRRKRQSVVVEDNIEQLDGSGEHDFATATGGFTIGIRPGDANITAAYVMRRLEQRQTLLIYTATNATNLTFEIDTQTSVLYIDINSVQTLISTIEVNDPTGKMILAEQLNSSSFVQLYRIRNVTHGIWKLKTFHEFKHNIELSGDSSISCTSTLGTKQQRESADSYIPFLKAPLVNQSDLVLLTKCANIPTDIRNGSIFLQSRLNEILAIITPTMIGRNEFVTPIVIPNVDFRILTVIELTDNTRLQRQTPQVISPSLINIEITNQPYILVANNTINITYNIINRALQPLDIKLCITDTLKLFNDSTCIRTYRIDSFNETSDQFMIFNRFYGNRTNDTSSIVTFSISAPVNTPTSTETTNNYNEMTLFLANETYVETPLTTTTQMTTTTPVSTTLPTVIIFKPLCS